MTKTTTVAITTAQYGGRRGHRHGGQEEDRLRARYENGEGEEDYEEENNNTSDDSIEGDNDNDDDDDHMAPEQVVRRIERLVERCIEALDEGKVPVIQSSSPSSSSASSYGEVVTDEDDERDESKNRMAGTVAAVVKKRLTLSQARSYTSLLLVAGFCHELLLSQRTTTIREVYYGYVTHFKSQRECNASIHQLCLLLRVPRHALGLRASPRGWFCGDVQFLDLCTGRVVLDGRAHAAQGHAVTSDWLVAGGGSGRTRRRYRLHTCQATCVLVVEKEGVYQRLVEDGLCTSRPCILVTSRGFPDWATRAFVAALRDDLGLPVMGLADCNPFGVSVLNTFLLDSGRGGSGAGGGSRAQQQPRRDDDNDESDDDNSHAENGTDKAAAAAEAALRSCVHWMGLRPSQVEAIRSELPAAVFQTLTPLDVKRLQSLLSESSPWMNIHLPADDNDDDDYEKEEEESGFARQHYRARREHELLTMLDLGYKVELEALHWLGMDYLTNFVCRMLDRHMEKQQQHNHDEHHLGRSARSSSAGSFASSESHENEQEDDSDDVSVNAWLDVI
jgi:meiotic recombination protein SPO11